MYVIIYSFENIEAFNFKKTLNVQIKKSKTWKCLTSKKVEIEYEDF